MFCDAYSNVPATIIAVTGTVKSFNYDDLRPVLMEALHAYPNVEFITGCSGATHRMVERFSRENGIAVTVLHPEQLPKGVNFKARFRHRMISRAQRCIVFQDGPNDAEASRFIHQANDLVVPWSVVNVQTWEETPQTQSHQQRQ
jgi:hypothetical protein